MTFEEFAKEHVTDHTSCVAMGTFNLETEQIETSASGNPDVLADTAIAILRHTKQLDVPAMIASLARLYASIGSDHMRVQIKVDGTWRDVADADTLRALL